MCSSDLLLGKRPNKFGYFLLAGAAVQAGILLLPSLFGLLHTSAHWEVSPWAIILWGAVAVQVLAGVNLLRPRH